MQHYYFAKSNMLKKKKKCFAKIAIARNKKTSTGNLTLKKSSDQSLSCLSFQHKLAYYWHEGCKWV